MIIKFSEEKNYSLSLQLKIDLKIFFYNILIGFLKRPPVYLNGEPLKDKTDTAMQDISTTSHLAKLNLQMHRLHDLSLYSKVIGFGKNKLNTDRVVHNHNLKHLYPKSKLFSSFYHDMHILPDAESLHGK